ncbi:MAG: alpha/beta hydrolase [Candidatus Nephthysia bennettiae]|uniref:Alpha/beta hydrolase n=1 Tax=Candidatus Nephthysia bennettiae TaxID=3127016 RepID=A0A934KBD5_9BACT|nr:alpha/beta hydrolase [Candidatus Dormibacteraeota bacterium]MBJ7612943.1 alpha/beta hydrolase [Candidatus Dormibacteraeota bacterium]PZR85478.1 MAG: alpha/beta hydrolase [Candidatus Dormibacteraeota bacterium]
MQELHIEANGLRFRCLAAGPEGGPLALLLHGFPEGAESWSFQLEALAAHGLRAVAPDLRGYGGTACPPDEEAYRMSELVEDVAALIRNLGASTCHLAGHDWGSLVGWSVTSRHPELVGTWSALSVGHPAALSKAMREDEDQRRRSSYIGLFRERGKAEEVLQADGYRRLRDIYRTGPSPEAIPAGVVESYVRDFSRPGRLTAALNYYRVNLRREGPPMAEAGLTTPTQLLWGDQDPAVGRTSAELTATFVAGDYRLVVLEGAGHWLQFERPEEVSRLLVEWIRSHAQPVE